MKNYYILLLFNLCFVQYYAQKKFPSNTWTPVTVNCKIGYVNPEGKMMIEPQFEHAWPFSQGLAFVWKYVNHSDANKNLPLGEEYKYYDIVSNSITGIIDSTGTYIVQPKLNFQMVRPFQDGIAYVRIDNEVKIINKKGMLVPYNDPLYDKEYNKILRVAKDKNNGTPSYANGYSQVVYKGFDGCEEFSENFAAVRFGNKYGYINRKGELTVVPQFSEANPFSTGYATVAVTYYDDNNKEIKRYGLIDTLGNFVLAPKYLWLSNYSEGFVIFNDGGLKSGFMDLNGNVLIKPIFNRAYPFSNGLACVHSNGKCGYINTKGEIVIEQNFTWGTPFKNGVATVTTKDDLYGLINEEGKFVFGPIKKDANCD
ncbi:MAG: WG repeat-containing protein [Bacteroidia bacterium]